MDNADQNELGSLPFIRSNFPLTTWSWFRHNQQAKFHLGNETKEMMKRHTIQGYRPLMNRQRKSQSMDDILLPTGNADTRWDTHQDIIPSFSHTVFVKLRFENGRTLRILEHLDPSPWNHQWAHRPYWESMQNRLNYDRIGCEMNRNLKNCYVESERYLVFL